MGGRFGKYGDLKRRRALQRSRREKNRLAGLRKERKVSRHQRRHGNAPEHQNGGRDRP